ncbi:MAG: hypothetical protein ACREFR_04135, partial [Limisphaerales bacterium]
MNAIGASILLVLVIVVLLAPRRWALMGMIAGVLFLTEEQAINIAGFNMFAIRFLEVAGFLRVMIRREFSFQQLNKIDYAILLLYGYTTAVYLLRASEGAAYQVGLAVDAFASYFTFRGLFREME